MSTANPAPRTAPGASGMPPGADSSAVVVSKPSQPVAVATSSNSSKSPIRIGWSNSHLLPGEQEGDEITDLLLVERQRGHDCAWIAGYREGIGRDDRLAQIGFRGHARLAFRCRDGDVRKIRSDGAHCAWHTVKPVAPGTWLGSKQLLTARDRIRRID